MQALIDFDGWRKWKAFDQPASASGANAGTAAAGGNDTDKKKAKKELTPEEKAAKEAKRAALLAKMVKA